ncbi:expressed unknown protein [Seminavis robusta]|uniref:Uncharacterized protein n=1 Tax=Seminavis robusta TaxID=568900 RepID=A0A9N8D911_9STRA|nr:expressed unknown protein [Seminavis robusta]|eukprot:Sro4_g003860.1 n/a (387) ;mRNA; f:262639-263977
MLVANLLLLVISLAGYSVEGFQLPARYSRSVYTYPQAHHPLSVLKASSSSNDADEELDLNALKAELTEYLAKRKEVDADTAAQRQVGKVVGGTKGNPILEYVSGSPNKEIVIDEAPNAFDYDELERYGYGSLVTTIMKNGGRNAMYDLLGMERPPPPKRLKPKKAPKLVIDKTGETDRARYTGLKMGQVMDDDLMAEALANAQAKAQKGESLRPKIAEEDYVQPFADKRNTSPLQTPDWTPEKLDEYGKSRGRALAWARRAKLGEFVQDPMESIDLPLVFRVYAIGAAFFVAFAFGRATPNLLAQLDMSTDIMGLLQVPALAIVVASLGSAIVNGVVLAPSKNRNTLVWAVKGFLAGPVAVSQLRGLEDLVTLEEEEEKQRQQQQS